MRYGYDRFAERHSFDLLGFIQLLYDTTSLYTDFWVKPVWGLGCTILKCPKVTFDGSVHGIFQICLNLPQYSLIKISVTRKLNLKLVLVLESGQCGLVS